MTRLFMMPPEADGACRFLGVAEGVVHRVPWSNVTNDVSEHGVDRILLVLLLTPAERAAVQAHAGQPVADLFLRLSSTQLITGGATTTASRTRALSQ
jgi:hypothetical protein